MVCSTSMSRKDKREKILVQVKGGKSERRDVATLIGDMGNQGFKAGVLITLDPPTPKMKLEAVDAKRYTSKIWSDRDYPRVQILTVEGLLNKTERLDCPPRIDPFASPKAEGIRS